MEHEHEQRGMMGGGLAGAEAVVNKSTIVSYIVLCYSLPGAQEGEAGVEAHVERRQGGAARADGAHLLRREPQHGAEDGHQAGAYTRPRSGST